MASRSSALSEQVCLDRHFESLALVPVRIATIPAGLIHLCDPRPNRIDTNTVCFVEEVSDALGLALARKAALDALAASEDRLQMAFEASADGMFDYHPKSGEMFYSLRWFTMLGYQPTDFRRHSIEVWTELMHPKDAEKTQRELTRHMRSGRPFSLEFRLRTKEGPYRWILCRGRCVEQDIDGTALRMVGTHTDITPHAGSRKPSVCIWSGSCCKPGSWKPSVR